MSINVWSQNAVALGASYVGIGDGHRWVDVSGNGHDGVLNSGASITGTTLDLDGVDDFVNVTGDTDFNPTASWSIEFILTPNTTDSDGQFLMAYGPSSGANGFAIFGAAWNSAPRIDFGIAIASTSHNDRFAASTLTVGTRHHVVITMSGGVAGTIAAYVDGSAISLTTPVAGTTVVPQDDMTIGKKVQATSSWAEALFDGLAIYPDVTLTAAQVSHLHDMSNTHPTAGGGGGGG